MKKILIALSLLTIVLSFSACRKDSMASVIDGAGNNSTDIVSKVESPTAAPTTTAVTKTTAAPTAPVVTTKVSHSTSRDDGVYVMKIYQNNFPDPLSDTEANEIRNIIGKYSMNTHSWDNLPDYTIIIDGTYYSYETSSGIITKDDTHADKLSDADRKTLNEIIGTAEATVVKTTKAEPTAGTGTTIIDTFIITKVSGTYLELNKVRGNDVVKLIYSCDIGGFDGSADMNYKVGDYIVLRYDQEITETCPIQLTVREIYPPQWNN